MEDIYDYGLNNFTADYEFLQDSNHTVNTTAYIDSES